MLYPKNQSEKLDRELFKMPTSEYRAAPFWSWNCELKPEILMKEIEYMKQMGFGGFHMHPRVGLATPYLSDEFMDMVKMCVNKAKQEKMLAWLYDEDKWPSGFAGGLNTKDIESREKCLVFGKIPYNDDTLVLDEDKAIAGDDLPKSKYYFVRCYDVELNSEGYMTSYKTIGVDEKAEHTKYFAYVEYTQPSTWYNGQAYADTLSKPVIENFVKLTHERYKAVIGDEFGKTVPAIFTDEPQFKRKRAFNYPTDERPGIMPYTTDLNDTYKAAYGIDLIDHLPEIFFDKPDGEVSRVRYYYHDHISERFASAFADTVGKWCDDNGIKLTGHMMQEPSLLSQTAAIGDCMRSYRGFALPGIDMLSDHHELSTAKQCESAVHQYGREGMTSELYGVTNWHYDFKGHKLQGDWQAALGVTVRVPHLYWASMKGEAKRDYPASIGHQSPWYKEYGYIENHFARVNTAMTRGKPHVKIGLFHPVESYWLCYGPSSLSDYERSERQRHYYETLNWLLFATLDFDIICESLLPSQFAGTDGGFCVGQMKYDTVIVAGLKTIRSTSLDALEQYQKAGGHIVFMGEIPTYVDAEKSDRATKFAEKCTKISWSTKELYEQCDRDRDISIRELDGSLTKNLIYQMRDDGDDRYVFVSHVVEPMYYRYESFPIKGYNITLTGEWKLTYMNTLTGEMTEMAAGYENGNTLFTWETGCLGSLLIHMEPGRREQGAVLETESFNTEEYFTDSATFTLEEPNVLVLDHPSFSVDGGEMQPADEILRVDDKIRIQTGTRRRTAGMVQPWLTPFDKNPQHTVTLKYDIDSDIEYDGAQLALESSEYATVTLNGVKADMTDVGWYVDEDAIRKIDLPHIARGRNTLTVEYRFGDITQLERMYILGDFGVEVHGSMFKLVKLADKLGFGSITSQTLPFYGGNLTYHMTYTGSGKKTIDVARFSGTALSVAVDGKRLDGMIAFPPQRISLGELSEGTHTIDITFYGNRTNTFGSFHDTDPKPSWQGPDRWRTNGRFFSYEYLLRDQGILTAPRLLSNIEK